MASSNQQYDAIVTPYDYVRGSTIALIERLDVCTILQPLISGADVLELACGSGFYTYDLVARGSRSVVAVDISAHMLDKAQEMGRSMGIKTGVTFIQSDCVIPDRYEGGPFDVVFGAWLLNYAPDHEGLINMFRTVALNLKDGGTFVSVTLPPSSNPIESLNAEASARPEPDGSGYLNYKHIKDVDYGIFFGVHAETPFGKLYFECYHLTQDIIEEAAMEAGLEGRVEWRKTNIPDSFFEKNPPGGATSREMETYLTVPAYGILIITK